MTTINWILALTIAATTTAHAGEARVSSVVQEEFTISYARASGEAKTTRLGKAASAANDTTIDVVDRGTTTITVADGTGKAVAKGTVSDNGAYLLMPKGSGYTLEHVGSLASKSDVYPGVVIVNALPASYKVDLYGHFGKIGLKSVKIGTAFDAGQAIRIPSGDDRFKATIHLPDGSTVDSFGMVSLGRFHVIHMTYDDKVTVSSLGWIDINPKKK
jgi:hypothetical protein